jgi:hypothetical protein
MKIYLKKVPADGYSCSSNRNETCYFYKNSCAFPLNQFNFTMQCIKRETSKPMIFIEVTKKEYNKHISTKNKS